MKNIFLTCMVVAFSFSACNKKTHTTISPINKHSSLSPNGLIYSLPKTSLKILVESELTTIIPGPYGKYAEKFLGISDVPVTRHSAWSITDVSLITYNHADINSLFVVEPNEEFVVDFLHLSSEGLIIPSSGATFQTSKKGIQPKITVPDQSSYLDLSPTPFIAAERTTHYSRVFQDTSYVRVPVHKTVVVEKTIEDKAREAADFIFSLRKRRFELLSGDADFVAEGRAAEAVLSEIKRLEAEYLLLFTGKEYRSSSTHWFDYSPSASNKETSTILFRFSSARGVLSVSDLSGSPVLISIIPDGQWLGLDVFDQLSNEMGEQLFDVVYYRLPVPVSVKIYDSKVEFYSQTLTFYQFGPLLRIPTRFIINQNGSLLFPKKQ